MTWTCSEPCIAACASVCHAGWMCGCGCLLLIAVAGGLVYCLLHGLWIVAALLIAAAAAAGWFGRKMLDWRPGARRRQ